MTARFYERARFLGVFGVALLATALLDLDRSRRGDLVVRAIVFGVGIASYYLGRASASAPAGEAPHQHLTR